MGSPDFASIMFGAFLGAALSYVGLYVQELNARKGKLLGLLAELQDNFSLSERVQLAGGRAKQRLLNTMWEIFKGEAFYLPSELANTLRSTYATIINLNAVIDYDLQKVDMGSGALNQAIEVMSTEAKRKLEGAIRDLKAHLKL